MLSTIGIALLVGAPLAVAAYVSLLAVTRVIGLGGSGLSSSAEVRTRAEFDRIRAREQRILPPLAASAQTAELPSATPRVRVCSTCAHTVNSAARLCWRCGAALELLP